MRNQESFDQYVADELRAADLRMDKLIEEVTELKQDQARAQALLEENVKAVASIKEDTADMLATFESWRGAMRALEMIGRFAKPVSYIIGLFAAAAGFFTAMKSGVGTK